MVDARGRTLGSRKKQIETAASSTSNPITRPSRRPLLFPLLAAACLALLVAPAASADIILPTNGKQGEVRIYNPSEISVSGQFITSDDGVSAPAIGTPYSLNAHEVITFPTSNEQVRIVPDNDSEGNQLPDPVVDMETDENGFIASPPMYKTSDLTNTEQLFGLGTGADLYVVIGDSDSEVAISAIEPDGKVVDAKIMSFLKDSVNKVSLDKVLGTLPADTVAYVQFLSGSGVGTLAREESLGDTLYQKMAERPGNALGQLFTSKWIKPASKALKLTSAESDIAINNYSYELAEYAMANDSRFSSTFNNATDCADWFKQLIDGDRSNGELYGHKPIKEKNGAISFKVYKKDENHNQIDYLGLADKVRRKPFEKITISGGDGRAFFSETLIPGIAKGETYYEGFNTTPKKDGALWAHKKANW